MVVWGKSGAARKGRAPGIASYQAYEGRKATNAARDSVDLARKNAHFDQRAWLNVSYGNYRYTIGQPFSTVLQVLDTGRTPARNVKGTVVVHLLKVGEKPAFTYDHGESVETGTMFPNVSQAVISWLIPTSIPWGQPVKPMLITGPIFQDLKSGKSYILVYGKLTYDSAFGANHFFQFCATSGAVQFAEPKECIEYNDVDNNEEP